MSQPLKVAGFEVIISGRFWVIAEASPGANRVALGFRIPDLRNARLRLALAAPWLAESARDPVAAPRIVNGADRAEHKSSYPMEVDQRSQWASRPEPRRRTSLSSCPLFLCATEGSGVMLAENSKGSGGRNTDGIDCGNKLAVPAGTDGHSLVQAKQSQAQSSRQR